MKRSLVLVAIVALLCACAGNNAPKSDPGQAGSSNTTVHDTAEQAKKIACDAYNDVRPFIPDLRALAVLDAKVDETFKAIDTIVAAADPNHDLDKLVQRACSGDPSAQEAMTALRPLLVKLALYEATRSSKPKTETL
jgi:ABC-type Fe3+-hydroxamate transport system substrate-binding protein